MAQCFYTIINIPYEGCLITEYATKAKALKAHKENMKNTDLLGAALVHIEVIDEKGEWKEVIQNG